MPTEPRLRIRMYNVGFGDAFLLFVPTDDGERTVLVDCGVHMGGVVNKISAVAQDIVATVTTDGRARIDVVVATHRHADHISGFGLKLWKTVEVGEVWLPWTEEPSNEKARRIRKSQNRLAAQLAAMAGPRMAGAFGWAALNALSNEDSEHTLLHGFVGKPTRRFLPAVKRDDRTFETPALPGVTVHALGPSHDPKVIATMEPPKGAYFPLAADGTSPDGPRTLFGAPFCMDAREYRSRCAHLAADADPKLVRAMAQLDPLLAASGLEDAINGTSLVLVLEVGDRCLLLGGDAEWGTWSEILADADWCELLGRTSVYKVSHHGSYNGTPKPFVDEHLPAAALSIVSLLSMEQWPSIPRKSLLRALGDGDRVLVRSDRRAPSIPGVQVRRQGDLWVELSLPVEQA